MDTTGDDDFVAPYLAHFGVLGMRWGKRKQRTLKGGIIGAKSLDRTPKLVATTKLKAGGSISILKNPPSRLSTHLDYRFPSRVKNSKKISFFSFKDAQGKDAGGGSAFRETKNSLYLDLISVKSKERGRSHHAAAVKGLMMYARNSGAKQVRVDVPTHQKELAAHYKKLGFVPDGPTVNFGAGGRIQPMKADVNQVQHADQTDVEWENQFADEFAAFLQKHFGEGGESAAHADEVDDFLEHFGVKGMRWGQKKGPKEAASADASKAITLRDRAKRSKPKALSNAELQTAINRMQLEQNYKRLAVNEKPAVTRFISSTLLEIGKREVQTHLAKKVAGTIAKKIATGGAG